MSTHLVLEGRTAVLVTKQERHKVGRGGTENGVGVATCYLLVITDDFRKCQYSQQGKI